MQLACWLYDIISDIEHISVIRVCERPLANPCDNIQACLYCFLKHRELVAHPGSAGWK